VIIEAMVKIKKIELEKVSKTFAADSEEEIVESAQGT
jgi:hypothetical protein